jgi:hypothetical protein
VTSEDGSGAVLASRSAWGWDGVDSFGMGRRFVKAC